MNDMAYLCKGFLVISVRRHVYSIKYKTINFVLVILWFPNDKWRIQLLRKFRCS